MRRRTYQPSRGYDRPVSHEITRLQTGPPAALLAGDDRLRPGLLLGSQGSIDRARLRRHLRRGQALAGASAALGLRPRAPSADSKSALVADALQDALHELGMLLLVHGRAAGSGAGGLDAAHVAQGEVVAQQAVEAPVDERPGAHVLGLLLQPDHL